ncbi:MAG: Unknown protein [uncultured Thiotrichaceae bacterium]|uniref:Inner membrane protein YgaP-like transmembrane domain-containing protein n=1 Tax=uncultured Thiotrichaceae bacterium TaxID=298394 RepID=A0A6S6TUK4_9GAMM|nr:MAG: Unknown protein [uncultured Thiotrichaceae bacterium]
MNFQRNVGRKDKNIRIAAGIALIVVGFLSYKLLMLIGAIVLATGVFSFCGLYQLLGMNTATAAEQVSASDDLSERASENIDDFKQEATETAQELKEEAIETAQELKEDAEELIEDAKEKIEEVTDSMKKK